VICTKRFVLQCRLKLESVLEHEVFALHGISKHSKLFAFFSKQLPKIVRTSNDSSSNHPFDWYLYQVCRVVKVSVFRKHPLKKNAASYFSRAKIAGTLLNSKKKPWGSHLQINLRVRGGGVQSSRSYWGSNRCPFPGTTLPTWEKAGLWIDQSRGGALALCIKPKSSLPVLQIPFCITRQTTLEFPGNLHRASRNFSWLHLFVVQWSAPPSSRPRW